ncbi:MAG TPA: DNA polymerase I [Treponemataceae bacterium]|nr:DNA polymerase I [Treponemataceae bacterium]
MKKPIYVLDAYGLIYRSYFAFINKPLTNPEGKNVSAVFGFFRALHALLAERSPELFLAAFDSRTPTFRHELYAEYKATRQKTPEDLHAQVPVIEEILTALGVPLLRQDGFEADDIIASVAEKARAEGRGCVIVSGDKDLMQLVGGTVSILKPGKAGGWEAVDAEGVRAEWGVGPELMLDLLSLTGDASDNVPGVRGVGDKTAVKLLSQYGTLDGVYEHAAEIPGAMGKKVIEGKEMAYFSRRLIALCADVPLEADLDSYSAARLDGLAASRLLMREGVPSVARLYSSETAEAPSPTGAESSRRAKTAAVAHSGRTTGFATPPLAGEVPVTGPRKNEGDYRTLTEPAALRALVDRAIAQGFVAFDCETTGLDARADKPVGFSLSLDEGTGFYVPLRAPEPELGEDIPLMSEAAARAELARLFASPCLLVAHNAKFDYQVMRAWGAFERLACPVFDTMIAAWLLDPDWGSFSLEALSLSQLGLETVAYADVVPKGKTFADVPIAEATQYAAEDADLALRLRNLLTPRLAEAGLDGLFSKMEMPLIPILAEMEIAGIRLEKGALASFSGELEGKIAEAEGDIYRLVGHEFNIASPKQLQEVLFTERKLTPGKKTKTGFSTDTSVLEDLASEDPLPGKILDYRALAKLKSTYVDALPALADANGRVHTSFIQTGTATGRLSSRDPNLQNIPVRDENGRRIRTAFRSADGFELISADYAQIELVILAHLSGDPSLVEAFKSGVDVHRRTAGLIFGVGNDEVTPDMRRIAKTINFGVMYGMSAFRLANELRIPRGQAAGFINAYFETYAGVSRFIAETKERAAELGYVETLMGRRRYIRGIQSSNKLERSGAERIAVNTPIQGSAADIVKAAMIRVDRALRAGNLTARLLLQVHDELILEAPVSEVAAVRDLVKKEMEAVIELAVPLRVSVESGPSWGDFH